MLMISVEPGDELLRMQIGMKLAGSGTFMTEIHKEEFHFLSLVRIQLPPGTIRCSCQLHGEFKEVVRLAGEEQVGRITELLRRWTR
jgi:hypothetical protein